MSLCYSVRLKWYIFIIFFLIFYNVEYLPWKTSRNIEDPIAFRLEYQIRLSILIAKVLAWLHALRLMPFVGNFPLCVSNEMLTGQRFIFVLCSLEQISHLSGFLQNWCLSMNSSHVKRWHWHCQYLNQLKTSCKTWLCISQQRPTGSSDLFCGKHIYIYK